MSICFSLLTQLWTYCSSVTSDTSIACGACVADVADVALTWVDHIIASFAMILTSQTLAEARIAHLHPNTTACITFVAAACHDIIRISAAVAVRLLHVVVVVATRMADASVDDTIGRCAYIASTVIAYVAKTLIDTQIATARVQILLIGRMDTTTHASLTGICNASIAVAYIGSLALISHDIGIVIVIVRVVIGITGVTLGKVVLAFAVLVDDAVVVFVLNRCRQTSFIVTYRSVFNGAQTSA